MRIVMAAVVAAGVLALAPRTASAEVTTGKAAPSLGDTIEVIQGDPFTSLKDLRGHVVRLVFFANW
jgi:hypothetical protein